MGFGDAMPISALQGDGLAQLAVTIEELQAVKRREMGLSEADEGVDGDLDASLDDKPLQLAILGRQNVGKVSAHV